MLSKREEKLKRVAAFRQKMTVVLENVHDPHNIGAVLRTCDAVGIQEIFIIFTDERLDEARLNNIKVSSTGVRKWMDIHVFRDIDKCFQKIKKDYSKILATHLDSNSQSVHKIDLTEDLAIILGNEHEGISEETLKYADANIKVPQYGMVQSLNISVACAVILYESARQREEKGLYDQNSGNETWRNSILAKFRDRHK